MEARTTRPEVGVGLRPPHFEEVLARRPRIAWFEVHAENYMLDAVALRALERVRALWPISLHGVSLSLGGADAIDSTHLSRLAALVERLDPFLVSEHMSWSAVDGVHLNDLLPLPFTAEALGILTCHVDQVQEALGRQILLENPSGYLRFSHSTMSEAEFLAALVRSTGCRVLFDVNNVYVSSQNIGVNALEYMNALPPGAVGEIHLAGHSVNDVLGHKLLIDDHGSKVSDPVWELYRYAVRRFGGLPTLIEWDNDLPPLDVLLQEARKAADILCLSDRAKYATPA
jgi:uncharacterized protein